MKEKERVRDEGKDIKGMKEHEGGSGEKIKDERGRKRGTKCKTKRYIEKDRKERDREKEVK